MTDPQPDIQLVEYTVQTISMRNKYFEFCWDFLMVDFVHDLQSTEDHLITLITVVCFLIPHRSINKDQFQRKKNDTLDPELYVCFLT